MVIIIIQACLYLCTFVHVTLMFLEFHYSYTNNKQTYNIIMFIVCMYFGSIEDELILSLRSACAVKTVDIDELTLESC